jgi:predicted CxxxxCH...CXXCH cytochrome family protein
MANSLGRSVPRVKARLAWSCLALLVLGATASSSCLKRRAAPRGDTGDGCTACHGDATRAGEPLLRAAPPGDLFGSSDASYPGVGAHSIHLRPSATHAAVPCQECHVVPERTDSPGHADDAAPAEVTFGDIAKTGGANPRYDAVTRRCDNSYCHGAADAVWSEPRDSAAACGSCHGLPPPPPHTASSQCSTCHGEVIDARLRFTAPELHVDGQVQLRANDCTQCHGGGDDPAPPADTLGNIDVGAIGVGAHTAHLSGGSWSRPLACGECHQVPSSPEDFAHADGLPAEVELTGVAQTAGRDPRWLPASGSCVDGWCHAPGERRASRSPSWTETAALTCDSCHGLPPAAPHPQMDDCSVCHGDVIASDRTVVAAERHVDGTVDVRFDAGCTSCHGGDNPAPPRAVAGQTQTSYPGVGAHQTHVLGTERSRAVPCGECHAVPQQALDAGHIDTFAPAEVVFSGAAAAFEATPSYTQGQCSNTACHGARFTRGHDSGGTLTVPSWTVVDGSQATCGSCHGLPPPPPHPYADDCGSCHANISLDGTTFLRPDLHVDGAVTFQF